MVSAAILLIILPKLRTASGLLRLSPMASAATIGLLTDLGTSQPSAQQAQSGALVNSAFLF